MSNTNQESKSEVQTIVKMNGSVTTTFVNLATFSDFESLVVKQCDKSLENLNTLHQDLYIYNKEWTAPKIETLYTFDCAGGSSFEVQLSRAADYYQSFSLQFVNCESDLLENVQFIRELPDKRVVIDDFNNGWIDIYDQMYQKIRSENSIILPFYLHRHNILSVPHPYCQDIIKVKFKKHLVKDQKVLLVGKYIVTNGALRQRLQNIRIKPNFFYDRIIQGEYTYDRSLSDIWRKNFYHQDGIKEPISTLSDIFITVKKLDGYPAGKELLKSISFGVEMCCFYMKEPAIQFRESQPLLQGLTPAKETDEYQGHYLISFAETSKSRAKEWSWRGGTNMNKLSNVWLDLEVDESIPKEFYKIELTLVCPTKLDLSI